MGGYVDVDYFGESNMDTAVFAIDWLVGMALPQTRNDEREVVATSACLCGDDCGNRIGSRCCGFYCFGDIEGACGSPAPYTRT